MSLAFESYIPENVVDEMNDARVHEIHYLDNSALRIVTDAQQNQNQLMHSPTCNETENAYTST